MSMVHWHRGDLGTQRSSWRATNTTVLRHRKHRNYKIKDSPFRSLQPPAHTDQWRGPLEVVAEAGNRRDEFFSQSPGHDGLQQECLSEMQKNQKKTNKKKHRKHSQMLNVHELDTDTCWQTVSEKSHIDILIQIVCKRNHAPLTGRHTETQTHRHTLKHTQAHGKF